MNEQIIIHLDNEKQEDCTDRVCKIFEKIGWEYERDKRNRVQVSFKTADDIKASIIVCVADVFPDKIYISTTFGVKTTNEAETLRLLNFINYGKIYYGRFVLASGEIWYDFTSDVKDGFNKKNLYRSISIAYNCTAHFCNAISDVANGAKTADEVIKNLR